MSLSGASVLITGGTGSWGHAAIARLLGMAHGPARVAILSRDEVKQAEMRASFHDDARLRFFLGDVRDRPRLDVAFRGADIVFHAAALKRIESCSYSPTEAIATNVIGSMNVAAAAEAAGVQRVVALSSDKACAPTNTYGVTKACMEHVFTASSAFADRAGRGTAFCALRYGNVAGSRGSVIPIWRAAIQADKPMPMIDSEATRFWFTLDGAVDLALWALEHMQGGEVFVPDLPGFTMRDLALAMARKYDPEKGLFQEFTKIPVRAGEKVHESMIASEESRSFKRWAGHYVKFLPGQEQGETLPDGFALSSNTARRMDVSELRDALAAV